MRGVAGNIATRSSWDPRIHPLRGQRRPCRICEKKKPGLPRAFSCSGNQDQSPQLGIGIASTGIVGWSSSLYLPPWRRSFSI